jgi:mono/diheme cytochrome c family protein
MHLRHVGLVLALAVGACGKKTPPPETAKPPATTETKAPETAKPPETNAAAVDAGSPEAADTAPSEAPDGGAAVETAAPAPDEALINAGKRIAAMGGCALCHTPFGPNGPDMAKMWGGGLEVPEAFGTWRSPNISQDKKTGIGAWTDEQIAAAIREGLRPDGSRMFPIMPYPFFNRMTDADVKALVAYLRTVPAIENTVAGNIDLKLPKVEVPKPANAPVADDPVHRGEYFATIGHCAACHTPMTVDGKDFDMKRAFSGGMPLEIPAFFDGVLTSPNITSDPKTGIGAWSEAELTALFKTGKKKDGTPVIGPMAMFVPGWQTLADGDISDLVAFVKAIPPIENVVPKSTAKMKGPPPGDAPPPAPPGDAPPKPDAPK